MGIVIDLNSKTVYSKNNGHIMSKENPWYNFTIYTPTGRLVLNEEDQYSHNIYQVQISAYTGFSFRSSNGFFSLEIILLGFGFGFSRQTDY